MELKDVISANLKRLRHELGISQSRLSESSGFSKNALSKMENDPSDFTSSTIQRLADGLGVSPSELVNDGAVVKRTKQELPKSMAPGIQESIAALMQLLGRVKK